MPDVDKKWAERIRSGDRRVLLNQFRHEAGELRRILMEQPASFHPPWRDFRNFLADVGPSPGPAYSILAARSGPGAYRPDSVSWANRAARSPPPPLAPSSSADAQSSYSQWTMISGAPVQYGELASRYGLSFAALSAAAVAGLAPSEAIEQARIAEVETTDLGWFSQIPAHQQAFREAYRIWKLRVQPKYRAAATPKFLYLYTLIPAMARCKATLGEAGLWKPLTKSASERRDDSPAWKRFNELLPKATVIVSEFEIYRQYSLTEDIDELATRVQAAELRFRTGAAKAA
jgi:hypothetical protein